MASRKRHQMSGMGRSPVGSPVLATTMQPFRMFGGQPQASQAAVLTDKGHRRRSSSSNVNAHPLDVAGVGVILDPGRFVRTAEPDEVGAQMTR